MQPDDVYPNDSTHFLQEPKDQAVARKKEKARTLEAKKELETVLAHLSERIAATDSVVKAMEAAEKYEITKDQALVVFDIVRQQLEEEYRYIKDLLEVHSPNR